MQSAHKRYQLTWVISLFLGTHYCTVYRIQRRFACIAFSFFYVKRRTMIEKCHEIVYTLSKIVKSSVCGIGSQQYFSTDIPVSCICDSIWTIYKHKLCGEEQFFRSRLTANLCIPYLLMHINLCRNLAY